MLAYYFGKTTINADIYDFKQEKYDEIFYKLREFNTNWEKSYSNEEIKIIKGYLK